MPAYLELSQIGKTFTRGAATTEVLREVSLDIAKGEYISIIGHSGCGKSTCSTSWRALLPPRAAA